MNAALIPLDDARNLLVSLLAPVPPRFCAPAQAVGQVAAQTIRAEGLLPAQALALRDGFALAANEIAGASAYSPVPLARAPVPVKAGDALPRDCDCVVDESGVEISGPLAQAVVESFPGENIRRAGEDFAAGAIIVAQGEIFRAAHVSALSAANVQQVGVIAPIVSIEGEASLANFLAAALACEGVRIAEDAPLRIVIGGLGSGEILAHGLALEPGRNISIAREGHVPVIVIPPLAGDVIAALHALILPAFDHLCGRVPRSALHLPLGSKIASRVGLAELALLVAREGHFHPLAVGDAPLQAFLQATHVALIAASSEGYAAGKIFSAFSIDGIAR